MKILNFPNILTLLRVLSAPVFIYLLLKNSQLCRFIAFVIFCLASITDFIDGYLARKWKQETEFGKFMDPIADKVLVVGALITFIFLFNQVEIWMVLAIIGRDMLITVLRYLSIQKGNSLQTSRLGKFKTAFQMISILVILSSLFLLTYRETGRINEEYRIASEHGEGAWVLAYENGKKFFSGTAKNWRYGIASFLPFYLMLVTTILTVISGLRYLVTNYRLLWPLPEHIFSRKKEKNRH